MKKYNGIKIEIITVEKDVLLTSAFIGEADFFDDLLDTMASGSGQV